MVRREVILQEREGKCHEAAAILPPRRLIQIQIRVLLFVC